MNVTDHKWFDPVCHMTGCQSLKLRNALKRLSFLAQTTGGTAGPDAELQAAIAQAQEALGDEPEQIGDGTHPNQMGPWS